MNSYLSVLRDSCTGLEDRAVERRRPVFRYDQDPVSFEELGAESGYSLASIGKIKLRLGLR